MKISKWLVLFWLYVFMFSVPEGHMRGVTLFETGSWWLISTCMEYFLVPFIILVVIEFFAKYGEIKRGVLEDNTKGLRYGICPNGSIGITDGSSLLFEED